MSNINNSDHGLQVLLKLLHMKGSKDLENLLIRCYEIQKKHQYEAERNATLVIMQKLIEEEVSKKYEKEEEDVDK